MEINQSDSHDYKKKFQESSNKNISLEDFNTSYDNSRKNSINMSYYFPGKNSFEEKDSNSNININNLNDLFFNIDLNSDNKSPNQIDSSKNIYNQQSQNLVHKVNNENINEDYYMQLKNSTQYLHDVSTTVPYIPLPRFFVIKSVDEDNILKSIRYKLWCSTFKGNQKLHKAFLEAENRYPIYLLFSVNGSGKFMGLAQMTSEVDYNANFNLWSQGEKWKGFFFVVWLIIKDVPNKAFRHLTNDMNDGKPITSSRDTQEISPEIGMEVLKIFKEYPSERSIIEDHLLDIKTTKTVNPKGKIYTKETGNNYNYSSNLALKMNINSEEYVPRRIVKRKNYDLL